MGRLAAVLAVALAGCGGLFEPLCDGAVCPTEGASCSGDAGVCAPGDAGTWRCAGQRWTLYPCGQCQTKDALCREFLHVPAGGACYLDGATTCVDGHTPDAGPVLRCTGGAWTPRAGCEGKVCQDISTPGFPGYYPEWACRAP